MYGMNLRLYLKIAEGLLQKNLDFPDHLHLLFIVHLWELVDFYFVLLDDSHDLRADEAG